MTPIQGYSPIPSASSDSRSSKERSTPESWRPKSWGSRRRRIRKEGRKILKKNSPTHRKRRSRKWRKNRKGNEKSSGVGYLRKTETIGSTKILLGLLLWDSKTIVRKSRSSVRTMLSLRKDCIRTAESGSTLSKPPLLLNNNWPSWERPNPKHSITSMTWTPWSWGLGLTMILCSKRTRSSLKDVS